MFPQIWFTNFLRIFSQSEQMKTKTNFLVVYWSTTVFFSQLVISRNHDKFCYSNSEFEIGESIWWIRYWNLSEIEWVLSWLLPYTFEHGADLMLHDLAIFGLTINLKCHLLWYLNYKLVPRRFKSQAWKIVG